MAGSLLGLALTPFCLPMKSFQIFCARVIVPGLFSPAFGILRLSKPPLSLFLCLIFFGSTGI
jgi:hypothetical protein